MMYFMVYLHRIICWYAVLYLEPYPAYNHFTRSENHMSLLILTATDFEMQAFLEAGAESRACTRQLCTGIGPVETALSLSCFLSQEPVQTVLHLGIAGAYPQEQKGAGLLDLCLAQEEVWADFGICLAERIQPFAELGFHVPDRFILDPILLELAEKSLRAQGMLVHKGLFATVSCSSGTEQRAKKIGQHLQALCENMEGAAAARVCAHFGRAYLELRCISNMVGDRNPTRWRAKEAAARAGRAGAAVVQTLREANCCE
jgi:futalosine hydrolase